MRSSSVISKCSSGSASVSPHRRAGAPASSRRQRRAQAGQSLIIAIAVLFLLAFLAALFITLLARNLERANRSSNVLTADFYAQAGVRYADQMLTGSPQGADWRPALRYYLGDTYAKLNPDPNTMTGTAAPYAFDTGSPTSLTTAEQAGYLAYVNDTTSTAPLVPVNPHDPDKFWLDQGFTRYAAQGGRYLIRVTYGMSAGVNNVADPYEQDNQLTSKYLRIESVGRTGVVDDSNPADPTVFTGAAQPTRLNATLVAYKPIGLTDYARFITNRDRRGDTFALGVSSRYNVDQATASNSSIVTPGVADFTQTSGSTTAFDLVQYPLVTSYGTINTTAVQNGASATVQGGSLRCNGNLRLYGLNVAYLDNTQGDDWEIAGNLTFDGYQQNNQVTDPAALHVVEKSLASQYVFDATPSNATAFDTVGGYIRDAGSGSDAAGYARNIQRLNPPAIDSPAPGASTGGGRSTSVTHYAALTDHGTQAATLGNDSEGAGPFIKETLSGPATVYVDNTGDNQPESSSAQVGATLRDDWLNPKANAGGNWHGPFYDPPGATIVFGPQYITDTNGKYVPRWGFTVTRSDTPVGNDDQSHVTWRWSGEKSTDTPVTASTCTFIYGAAPTEGFTFSPANPVYFLSADDTPQSAAGTNAKPSLDNDIVIYAEGNVRVRGVVSPTGASGGTTAAPTITDPNAASDSNGDYYKNTVTAVPHHVTIVSNQIAYIEGSLLKGGAFSTAAGTGTASSGPQPSSIAVLARRYVTLNTTQFLAGAVNHTNLGQLQAEAAPGGPQSTGALDFDADSSLTESFDLPASPYGPTTNYPTNARAADPALFVSQYSAGGDAAQSYGILRFVETAFDGNNAPQTRLLDGSYTGTSNVTLLGSAVTPNRVRVPLAAGNTFSPNDLAYTAAPAAGYDNFNLTFGKSPTSQSDYLLAKAAILPSDVRIEAVLYAQDNSFFVIPGDWFNDDASDTPNGYQYNVDGSLKATPSRPRPTPATAPAGATDEQFPMYGQPIDMKITIAGSVSENVPANVADQSAWMLHWGWIPKAHGSPTQLRESPHPQIDEHALEKGTSATAPGVTGLPNQIAKYVPPPGLTFVYDTSEADPSKYNRLDQYGRPLPFTPNLPVSPDLLYSGQATGNSLVQ